MEDKNLGIKWPIKKIIISEKDKKNISFEELKKIDLETILVAGSGIEPLTSGL